MIVTCIVLGATFAAACFLDGCSSDQPPMPSIKLDATGKADIGVENDSWDAMADFREITDGSSRTDSGILTEVRYEDIFAEVDEIVKKDSQVNDAEEYADSVDITAKDVEDIEDTEDIEDAEEEITSTDTTDVQEDTEEDTLADKDLLSLTMNLYIPNNPPFNPEEHASFWTVIKTPPQELSGNIFIEPTVDTLTFNTVTNDSGDIFSWTFNKVEETEDPVMWQIDGLPEEYTMNQFSCGYVSDGTGNELVQCALNLLFENNILNYVGYWE